MDDSSFGSQKEGDPKKERVNRLFRERGKRENKGEQSEEETTSRKRKAR